MFRTLLKRLGLILALALPLTLLGQGAAFAASGSGSEGSTSAAFGVSSNGLSHCGVHSPSVSWASPNPRLVNWSGTSVCDQVIQTVVENSSLYWWSGSSWLLLTTTSTTLSSPGYTTTSSGTFGPSFGGQFYVAQSTSLQLIPAQGPWGSFSTQGNAGCSGLQTNVLTCTASSSVFSLVGNPVISQGGVVNGTNYSASDIHPGTTVAIFGSGFQIPDQVIVTQSSSTWAIGAGSQWWYDGPNGQQINATLPTALQPGAATVSVINGFGQQSNGVVIVIQP